MFAASKSGSVDAKDPQFNYVTMLLHGNGTNGAQNNTFVDSSTNNFTITRNGNTTQGTFTPYGSNWSNYFNGSSSLSVNVSGVAAGTSTFTFEAWVYLNAYPGADAPFYDTRSSNGASTTGMQFGLYSTGALKFYDGTETNLGGTVPLNQWVHIAFVRNGSNVMTAYINGTATGTTVSSTRNFTDQYFWIGSVPGPTSPYINAYLSNLRWVVGTAVYTSNFTPSTTPLTAITNTKILTCQSNRFVDNSSNAFTITVNGSPSVQRFCPFLSKTAYSTSVIGGSGYFDGSGDYLSIPDNAAFDLGSGDFTIECWAYTTAWASSYNVLLSQWNASTAYIFRITSGLIGLYANIGGTQNYTATVTNTLNTWDHYAITRSSGTLTFWKNGTSVGTAAISGTINNSSDNVTIGIIGDLNSTTTHTGYISNMRLVKGTAVYTSAFTPSTTPLTAITNTSLLLSYTNAGILDNAMMNDLETVGNAQISTSVKKYGTGSMAFDGTGDYLLAPDSPNTELGSGDFTVECWAYYSSTSGTPVLIDKRSSTAGYSPFIFYTTGGTLVFYSSSNGSSYDIANGVTIGSVTTGTWYHVAVSRSGSSIRLFLNGTLANTITSSASLVNNSDAWSIGGTVGGNYLNGYIDDLRITKGYARYTTTFTPPTAAFADKG